MRLFVDAYELSALLFFLVYLARSKRPNTPHFVFKRIFRNFEVRAVSESVIPDVCTKFQNPRSSSS